MSISELEPQDDEGEGPALVFPRILAWFASLLALGLVADGLHQWALLLGLSSAGVAFLELPLLSRGTTVAIAVADLVAGVGLWLRAGWGTVVWIALAAGRIALAVGSGRPAGQQAVEATVIACLVVVHLVLIVLAARQERQRP